MSSKDVKRCSASSVFRKIQIKVTRSHYPPTRMGIIKKTQTIPSIHVDVEKYSYIAGRDVKDEMVMATMKKQMDGLKNM